MVTRQAVRNLLVLRFRLSRHSGLPAAGRRKLESSNFMIHFRVSGNDSTHDHQNDRGSSKEWTHID